MDFDMLNKYLLDKSGTRMELPFGPDTLVYKVVGKIFAIMAWQDDPLRISLKCDPEEAIQLRRKYPAVLPGYHLSQTHWNTIVLNGSIPDEEIIHMVEESYRLVVATMPRFLYSTLKKIIAKEKNQ
jgi:predicted DNA-binding protein (MmcQ/YjbR family)